jgi:hypothetical protein
VSVQALSCAFALRGIGASEKLVLLALANYADANMRCWPSQDRLAEDTELSARTVWSALKSLEEKRILSRQQRTRADGTRTTDVFTLHFALTIQPSPVAKSANGADDHSQNLQDQVATVATLTTFEPSDSNRQKSEESYASSDSRSEQGELGLVPSCPLHEVAKEAWNEMASRAGLPKVLEVKDARRKKLEARCGREGFGAWLVVLQMVERSAYLCGAVSSRGWKCDFDWVVEPRNWQRILEGVYENRHRGDTGARPQQSETDRRIQQMVGGAKIAAARVRGRQGSGPDHRD